MKAEIQLAHNFLGPKETSTKYTKPCEPVSKHPQQDNFVDFGDESQGAEESNTLGSFKPGTTIQYRIPRLVSPVNDEWEWYRGTIELVDEDWQMVLVIPENEHEPWRWVNRARVQEFGKDKD